MHEMSLAEGVLQVIEEAARTQAFSRVTAVWLEVGELACVEVEALRFCFAAVMRGSLAEDARLEIIRIPGSGFCLQCSTKVTLDASPTVYPLAVCPLCGGYQVQVTGGTELRVKELEVR